MTVLAKIDDAKIPMLFSSSENMDSLISKIREEATSFVADVKTEKGRAEIKSMAYKVSQSKVLLSKHGTALVSEKKAAVKSIDKERIRMENELDALRDEIKEPVKNWEEAESARIKKLEDDISEIATAGEHAEFQWESLQLESMRSRLSEIQAEIMGEEVWEEYDFRAQEAVDKSVSQIKVAIERREKHDADQTELAELRKAKEESERKQHEEEARRVAEQQETNRLKLAEEEKTKAVEQARLDAEQSAKAEAQRIADETEERERKAEVARLQIIKDKEYAESENIRIQKEAKEQEEKAREDERRRMQEKQDKTDAEEKRRADDKAHRTKINNACVKALMQAGTTKEIGQSIIKAIVLGEIPNIKLTY